MRNTKNARTLESLSKQLVEIDKQIAEAKDNCDACKAALDAAGR